MSDVGSREHTSMSPDIRHQSMCFRTTKGSNVGFMTRHRPDIDAGCRNSERSRQTDMRRHHAYIPGVIGLATMRASGDAEHPTRWGRGYQCPDDWARTRTGPHANQRKARTPEPARAPQSTDLVTADKNSRLKDTGASPPDRLLEVSEDAKRLGVSTDDLHYYAKPGMVA
jgi:hypothetical protein